MTDNDDRRNKGTRRVNVETLVEICGNEPGGPAFEAEAVDVSAQGMHVRTAYLPEEGAPLVCRFVDKGREIIVEGVVAWRHPEARGGEFGIQFTALDSGSVDALRELCTDAVVDAAAEAHDDDAAPLTTASQNPAGSRVRLHIDGLGSPMKARVRTGGTRKVDVGSNLEFLKVGRHLDIEDLAGGPRRSARIESVSVRVDPTSNVPELMVALRYDDAETTPEPSVIDAERAAGQRSPMAPAAGALHLAGDASTDDDDLAHAGIEDEHEHDDELSAEAAAMKGRFGSAATRAGVAAKSTGDAMAHYGAAAAKGIGRLFRGAGAKVMELKRSRDDDVQAPRRATSLPPGGAMSSDARRLRPQSSQRGGVASAEQPFVDPGPAKKARLRKLGISAAAVALLVTVGVIAMRKPAAPPGAEHAAAAAASVAVAAADVVAVDDQGMPAAAAAAPAGSAGVIANVPLFGATPMATMEPAPLGAPPAAGSAAPADEAAEELAAAKAGAPAAADETFPEGESEDAAKADGPGDKPTSGAKGDAHKKKAGANPASIKPWGRGTMHAPLIHRLRLDAPGGAIQGAITPTGFTVVIPGRRVMEAGKGIAGRDPRIAKVRGVNTPNGAQISFQFKDGVPGYRVRLRKDYVEILISSPEPAKDKVTDTKPAKADKADKKAASPKKAPAKAKEAKAHPAKKHH